MLEVPEDAGELGGVRGLADGVEQGVVGGRRGEAGTLKDTEREGEGEAVRSNTNVNDANKNTTR